MWKYVTRRIKDTLDKTCNVLEVKKTWACSNSENFFNNCSDSLTNFTNQKFICDSGSGNENFRSSDKQEKTTGSQTNDEDFKEKIRPKQCCLNSSFIGALTWSSAIICGWYTSQVLFLRRRRVGWEQRYGYPNLYLHQNRYIHTNNYQSLTPVLLGHKKLIYDNDSYKPFDEQFLSSKKTVESNNENETQLKEPNQTIDSAVHDLMNVLGDIEFELGIENIKAGDYKTAVSHLKLATSHNHASATFNLAICYEKGLGVEKNLNIAQECYQIASSLGHPKAMYNLGVYYIRGLGGLKKNANAARACFNAAANLGQREAQVALGMKSSSSNVEISKHAVANPNKTLLFESALKLQKIY